ncbi:hypothetical protein Tco_1217333 [Tanacetum coccineum]
MFHKKNIDYVYLLWEDLLFQIENKDAKKTNKMSYPRFTKIIIDYFMSKDQSNSRRNKMFWHTSRDDTMFTSMRCISKHEDTQVYSTILPTELTNQVMLESKAYQTYYAFSSKEKAPKPKYIRKKADSETYPKKKTVQAAKGIGLKSKAKIAKPDKKKQPAKKTKAKGLAILSKVVLTEAEQLKLVTKKSKKDFYVSYASGSGDGVDIQLKVPDEQQQKTSGTDEGTGTIPGVPNVPLYESESDQESWGDSEDEDDNDDDGDTVDDGESDDHDDDKEDVDDRDRTPSDYELTDDEKLDDEETMDGEEDDEVIKELYGDVNVIPPPPPFFNPLLQQQTPTSTTTTSTNPTVTLLEIPNFASVFKFNQRVSAFESEMSKFRQTNQFAEVVSSILGIVDMYLASKMKEAVDVAVQLQKTSSEKKLKLRIKNLSIS